jgi:hypothetical protein
VLKRLTLPRDEENQERDAENGAADQSETRMRRALDMLSGPSRAGTRPHGNGPAGAPRRHRFVQDGEVQVVHVTPHRERVNAFGQPADAAPAQSVNEERAARERAERALEVAQVTIRTLQTKLGHAELSLREALEQAASREKLSAADRAGHDELRAALDVAVRAGEMAERRQRQLEAELAELRAARLRDGAAPAAVDAPVKRPVGRPRKVPAPDPVVPAVPKKRGRPPTKHLKAVQAEPAAEPEPVKWWLTSKQTAKRAKRTTTR